MSSLGMHMHAYSTYAPVTTHTLENINRHETTHMYTEENYQNYIETLRLSIKGKTVFIDVEAKSPFVFLYGDALFSSHAFLWMESSMSFYLTPLPHNHGKSQSNKLCIINLTKYIYKCNFKIHLYDGKYAHYWFANYRVEMWAVKTLVELRESYERIGRRIEDPEGDKNSTGRPTRSTNLYS